MSDPISTILLDLPASDTHELIQSAQAGDADAFCSLCRVYETRLLRQAMNLCGNATIAEDLAQDTLVEGWRFIRRYDGRCQFFTWLCAILLNRHRNTLRRKSLWLFDALAERDTNSTSHFARTVADPRRLPDETAQQREDATAIRRCVDTLPEKHRQVVYLRFYVDDSIEGIAAALGCSVGTVKSRLFDALTKLRGMRAMTRQHPRSIQT
jgi:RNA polymerase sigma-70 factor (ECF subfamily)